MTHCTAPDPCGLARPGCACGDEIRDEAASTSSIGGRRCSATVPHGPHVYIVAMTGGAPGPVPTTSHICPGNEETR